MSKISESFKFKTLLITLLGLYVTHFFYIVKYAVNVPFWDEWDSLNPNGIFANPSLQQIFTLHNEHIIATTNVLLLILYKFDGWNIVTNVALNFVIYGLLVWVLIHLIEKHVIELPTWILLAFVIFLLSGISWENHFWAFQTQFHFSLLFLILSIFYLFDDTQSWRNLALGIFFSWLTIYSMSSGVVEIAIVLLSFAIFKYWKIQKISFDNQHFRQLLTTIALVGGALLIFLINYSKPSPFPPLIFPYRKKFWIYFFNLISGGMGNLSYLQLSGFIITLMIITPVIGVIWKSRFRLKTSEWVIGTAIISIIGALITISMGRAGLDEIIQSKSPRYAEVVLMLLPLSIAMWSIFLHKKQKYRNYLFTIVWLFCLVSFAKYWDYQKIYSEAAQQRKDGLSCIKNYYQNGGEANCNSIYPSPIKKQLDVAKTLNLSFVQELK